MDGSTGDRDEEYSWFVFQAQKFYPGMFTLAKSDVQIRSLLLKQFCIDVLNCYHRLITKYSSSVRAHCDWFLEGPHYAPMFTDYAWLIHEKACELVIAEGLENSGEDVVEFRDVYVYRKTCVL